MKIPVQTGYVFAGWEEKTGKIHKGTIGDLASEAGVTVRLSALWTPIVYTVDYDINGGENEPLTEVWEYGKTYQLPADVRKTGYVFIGWEADDKTLYEAGAAGSNLTDVAYTMVKLTAKWKAVEYTVYLLDYYENGESKTVEMVYDADPYELPVLEKRGNYNFIGWHHVGSNTTYFIVNQNKNNEVRNLSDTDGGVVLLQAVWAHPDTVEFRDKNGEFDELKQVKTSEDDVFLDEPKPGFKGGWKKVNDVLYVPEFLEDGKALMVFHYGEERAYRVYQDDVDLTEKSPKVPVKEGYLGEWVYDYEQGTAIVKYALEETYKDGYAVIYELAGGMFTVSQDTKERYSYAESIVLPTAETLYKKGYTFEGWVLNKATTEKVQTYTPDVTEPLAVVRFVATWKPIEYTITFVGTDVTTTYTVETLPQNISLPDNNTIPSRNGYTARWVLPILDVGNICVIPVYQPITVTLLFDLNGGEGSFAEMKADYGARIAIASPKRDNYTFLGWQYGDTLFAKGESVLCNFLTEDNTVELKAVWEITFYTATFVADGNIVGKVKFTKDDVLCGSLVEPNLPSKGNYTGVWDYTLTESDVTIVAKYLPQILTKDYYVDGVKTFSVPYVNGIENLFIPSVPGKIGCVGEWMSDGDENKAVYTEITYHVCYDSSDETETVRFTESFVLPFAEKEGYEFKGWSFNGKTYQAGEKVQEMIAVDGVVVEMKALWECCVYTLSFVNEDGSVVSSLTFTIEDKTEEKLFGNVPEINTITKKSGYTAEWALPVSFICGDMEVLPKYTLITYYVIFTYKDNSTQTVVEWTVEAGAIREPSLNHNISGLNLEWVYDKELKPENFLWNEETDRYELKATLQNVEAQNNFAIIFEDENGITLFKRYVQLGEKFVIPAPPAKNGYVGEWDATHIHSDYFKIDNATVLITALPKEYTEVKISAVYTPITYTIAYDTLGGGEIPSQTKTYGQNEIPFTFAQAPIKIGYTFGGWEFNGKIYAAGEEYVGDLANEQKTVLITAVWGMNNYKVLYINGDGEELHCVELAYEDVFELSAAFESKKYCSFTWVLRENGKVTQYAAGQTVEKLSEENGGEIYLYANWTPNDYYIYFLDEEGKEVGRKKIRVDVEASSSDNYVFVIPPDERDPMPPQKAGYEYAWESYDLKNAAKEIDEKGYMTVRCVRQGKSFKIVYTGPARKEEVVVQYDTEIFLLNEYEVQGKELVGWYLNEELFSKGQSVSTKALIAAEDVEEKGEIRLKAAMCLKQYAVTFYLKDADKIHSTSYYTIENTKISIPTLPYGYKAWDIPKLDENGGDKVAYAVKETDKPTVTFENERGERIYAVTVVNGKVQNVPNVPEKEGFIAEGGWNIPSEIEQDITLRLSYTPIRYVITFRGENGEVVGTAEYSVVDHNVKMPKVPEKEGYDGKWDIDVSALTTGDMDVYAKYVVEERFEVKFIIDLDGGDVYYYRYYTIECRWINKGRLPFWTVDT